MSLTISASQVASFISNPSSFTGYSSGSHVIVSGAISHTQATALDAVNATYIQATVSETTIANLSAISASNSTRSSLNKFSFVVSDTSATAAQLNSVQALSSVSVDASNVASITSSPASAITTLYTGTVPSGIGAAPITVSDTTAAATDLEAVNGYTTGKVTSSATTVTGLAADVEPLLQLADGVVEIASDVAVTVTDTTLAAEALNDINDATTGVVTCSSATTVTGIVSEVQTAMTANNAGTIAGIGAANVTLDDPATAGTQSYAVADIHTLIDTTGFTGKVTATVTEGNITSLVNGTTGLTGTGHSLTVTVTDAALTAAEFNTIDAVTTQSVILAPSTSGAAAIDGAVGVDATDHRLDSTTFAEVEQASTTGSGTGATFKVVTGADGTATVTLLNPGSGYVDNEVITLVATGFNTSGTGTNATKAITVVVNGLTTTAGNAVIESSTYATALTAFQSSGVTGLSASTVTISDAITVAQANALDALTTGAITATISDNGLSTLLGLTGTGNAYTTTLSDTAATASDLNTLIGKTTVAVDNTTANTVTGSLIDLNTLYVTNGSMLSAEGAEALTVPDTAIDAALLTVLNTETSGLITLTSATSISGAGSEIEALYDDSSTTEIAGLDGDLTVTLTGDTGTPTVIDADHLVAIDGDTTGLITIDSSATSLSGSYADVHTVLTSNKTRASATDTTGVATPTISGLDNLAVTLTGTTTLAEYIDIQDNYTTGVITASLEARSNAQLTAETTAGTKDIVSGNNLAFEVNDTTFTATSLIALNSMTTGTITLTGGGSAIAISGTAADLKTVYSANVAAGGNGFLTAGLEDAVATISDTNLSAADAIAINAVTTGNNEVNISAATRITGLLADVNTILADAGTDYVGEGAELITLTDATLSASALATLLANGAQLTTKTVTTVASSISGTEAEVSLILDDTLNGAAGGLVKQHDVDNGDDGSTTVVGLDGINVTLSGTPTAAQVNAIALRTTGTITATLSGTASAIATGLTETIAATGGHALTVNLTDTEVTAANISTISGLTTGSITLDTDSGTAGNQSPAISGSAVAINSILDDSTITGDSASALTITGGVSVSELNIVAAKTTGVITATVSDGDMTTLAGITETTNALSIAVTDSSVSATALDSLVTKTTGLVNVASTSTLTGTLAEVTATLGNTANINGVGTMKVSVSDTSITVEEAAALDALTTGAIAATISDTSLETLLGAGITGVGSIGAADTSRTAGTYTITESDYSAQGTGTYATFSIVVDAVGAATVTITNPGMGYALTNTVTVTDAKLGGGGGANLTFDVSSISGALSASNSWITTVASQNSGDTVISAANLATLDGLTDQVVTVTAPTVDGNLAEITTAFAANSPTDLSTRTISGLETSAITVTDTITQSEAETAQALSTGVLTATVSQEDIVTIDTPVQGTVNTVAALDNIGAVNTSRNVGTFVLTDSSSAASSGAGTGAAFSIVVAANGMAALDTVGGVNAATTQTDTNRTAGTYYVQLTADQNTSGAGAGARIKVVVAADGVTTPTFLSGGAGYADNDAISIASELVGGASGGTALTFLVNGVAANDAITITQTAAGSGYTVGDTFTAASTLLKTGGTDGEATHTLGVDLTFKVAALGSERVSTAGGSAYTITAADYTTDGVGSGATFTVAVDADGTATATLVSGGGGFAVNETITVTDAKLGGGGAPSFTFDVASIGAVSIADFIAQTTAGTYDVESGNALSVVFDDASVTATDLIAANSLTTGLITLTNAAGGATTITGTQADIKTIYAAEATTVSGVQVAPGFASIADSPIDIRGTVGLLSAADLVALDADTTGVITVTPTTATITGISGSYADVHAVLTQDKHVANATTDTTGVAVPTITGLLATGTAIAGIDNEANVGATADRVDSTTFAELASTGGSGIGATFKVVTAADGSATVTIVNAGAGYADNETLTISRTGSYGGASDITVRTNLLTAGPALTVTLTGSTTVAQVNDIIDNYSSLGALADGAAQGGIGVVTATVTETTMAELASLNSTGVAAIDGAVGIDATDHRLDSTTFNDVAQASTTGSGTGATFTVVTGADGTATVTLVNRGTGYVDNEVITLVATGFNTSGTGTNATKAITVVVNGVQNTTADLGISLSETTVAAAALNTLDAKTTGTITLASGTSLTGVLTNNGAVDTALSSAGISGIGAVNVTSSEGTNTVTEANDISSQTTGVVTATLPTGALTTFAGLNDTGNAFTVNVSDTGELAAATINALNAKTTGVVSLSATRITGALSDIKTLYDANTAGEVSGLGDEVVAISDTGTISSSDINSVNGLTTGVITVSGATTVSGTLADIKTAYASNSAGTITGLGDEAITVTDTGVITSTDLSDLDALTTGAVTVSLSGASVAAATLNSLDASTTQVVSASSVTTLTGTVADINTAYASSGISGLGDEAVTISDTSTTAATLNTLNGNTTGTVDASSVTTLTGTAAEANTMYATAGISGGGDEAVTITDTSIAASVLNTLDGNTTGSVNASSLTTITGTGTDALTAFESAGISGLTFDASSYIAGYSDLMAAFSSDLGMARVHYFDFGVAEGRSFDTFDDSSYLASYSDLLAAFGTNTDSALLHYINFGYSEGRAVDTFDENSYLASNSSLIGTVTDAAAHYVSTGYAASLALDTFNEFSYIASHSDLISAFGSDGSAGTKHFVEYGSAEGRSVTFDELSYTASHTDLISAFGTDKVAAAKHYIEFGSTEGRTTTFDASSYLAAHVDLRAAFGTDLELATKHYIEYGSAEGRVLT